MTVQAVGRPRLRILPDRLVVECKCEPACSPRAITQIADEPGSADQAHFSRFFTQPGGLSPRAFRQARRADGGGP